MRSPSSSRAGAVSHSAFRFALLVFFLVIGYYVGRPVYWTLESRIRDFKEGVASQRAALIAKGQGLTLEGLEKSLEDPDLEPNPDLPLTDDQRQRFEAINKRREERLSKAKAAAESAKTAAAEAVEEVIKETKTEEIEETKLEEEAKAGPSASTQQKEVFARGVRDIIHEGKPLLEAFKRSIFEKPETREIPPREEFALRKEMIEFRARNNVIVVTFANFAFMDFVVNWVRHLTDLGVFNILVGAMDTQILEGLYLEGVPVFDMESGMSTIDVGWGTPIFHKMGREKITLINVFLSMNYELLICDTDMVWLQNPLPWFRRWPDADVLTSSDEVIRTVHDDSLEHWDRAHAAYNIGILLYRPTEAAKRQAREWAEVLAADDKIWDQNAFNDLMRRQWGPGLENGNGLFYAYDGTLRLGVMPVSIFCSGHTYFVQHLYKQVGLQPYAVHTTFQYAGTPGKRHRLREAKAFYDKPEYYDPKGGVISFVPDLPEELLTGGAHTVESHFALVNHQLKQIRSALAIATILERTLVFPELWCRFDRMWYPHPGILPGTATPQPLLCPLDQVFQIHNMVSGALPEGEFGPDIPFREYSFLENPLLPEYVRSSKLSVQLCTKGQEGCPNSPAPGANSILQLPRGSTQREILEILTPFQDVKVLEFASMLDVFSGWTNVEQERKFNQRVKLYVGIWCCVNAHPGHIYYDMFADQKEGWLPKPPASPSEDHPPV